MAITDSAGTHLLYTGNPIGRAGNVLVFSSSTPGPGSVTSVWRTDGTERLTNVPGGVGEQATFAKHGDYVYFGAGRDDTGWELWRTDGMPEGTTLFKDINQNP